jgi:PII-like signaling protein
MQPYQPAKLLRLHLTERDRHQGKPLYEAIVETCRTLDIVGATVFRGLEGYGESAEIHKPRLLAHDLPIVIQIVDSAENIARLLPVLEDMLDRGFIAVSDVTTRRIQKTPHAKNV